MNYYFRLDGYPKSKTYQLPTVLVRIDQAQGIIQRFDVKEKRWVDAAWVMREMSGIGGDGFGWIQASEKEAEKFMAGQDMKKADIESHDGAMIAVFIPEDVAAQLRKITDGLGLPDDAELEKAESLHVTLAFLPGEVLAEKIAASQLLPAIQMVAYQHGVIEGKIQGYGVFNGADGKKVLYATLDSFDLPFIRTKICQALDSMGVEYGKEHGFVPHVTLAYFPEDWKLPEGFQVPDIYVKIDGISLAIRSNITTITLGHGDTRLGKTFEDHAGRPGLRGGSLPRGAAKDVLLGEINYGENDGTQVYQVKDASNIDEKYSTYAVAVTGPSKGKIIGSRKNISHNAMLSVVGENVDHYVRFFNDWDNKAGENVIAVYNSHAGINMWVDDWEAIAYKNIDTATETLQLAGLDPKKKLSIYYAGDRKKDINTTIGKAMTTQLEKHCGVCAEDMEYFGAPVIRDPEDVDLVSIVPDGAGVPIGATWKAEGSEIIEKREIVGGELYKREEAAFLLDQSLKFGLVPLAYVSEVDGEHGAAIWKTDGLKPTMDADQYGPAWIEKAAVIDYIMGQQDEFRRYVTHPDDPSRFILKDNELTFPADPMKKCNSVFTMINAGRELSPAVVSAIESSLGDFAAWEDIKDLIGPAAAGAAIARATELSKNKKMI